MAGCRKGLKICAAVTGILSIVILVVLVVLFVTIVKPGRTFNLHQAVKNPNYGGFKYESSASHISYRGNVVAEAPIEEDTIPARATHNITSSVLNHPAWQGELVEGL